MANNTYKKNLNLVASNINSLNLSGDGHVYGQLYCEDITVNDTLITDNVIVNDHLTTPSVSTNQISTFDNDDDNISIENDLAMNLHKITGLGPPQNDSDATTKKYVDDNKTLLPGNLVYNPMQSNINLLTSNNEIQQFSSLVGQVNYSDSTTNHGATIKNITKITGVPPSSGSGGGSGSGDLAGGSGDLVGGSGDLIDSGNTVNSLSFGPIIPTDPPTTDPDPSDPTDPDPDPSDPIDPSDPTPTPIPPTPSQPAVPGSGLIIDGYGDVEITPSLTTDKIQTNIINKTETPTYFYFGNITPGNYVLAEIPDMTRAEGDITVHIRCLEPGKKQTVVFNCIALPEKATITVLSHTHEDSSSPPLITVKTLFYATNQNLNNIGYLGFSCSNSSNSTNKVEISIYQNQTDKGDGQPYGNGFIPVTSITSSPLISNFITTYSFEIDSQIGTTGNMLINGDVSVKGDGTVNKLSVNVIDKSSSGTSISFNNNSLSAISSITATSLSTNSITSSLNSIGFNGKSLSTVGNIIMNNSNIVQASDVQLSTISGQNNNTISVNSRLNLGSNKITTSSVPITDNDVVNKLFVENRSFFEANGANIYTKPVVNNIGLGVTNPGHKLEVNGDTRVIGNTRQTSSTTDGVTYITNSQTKSEGLNNFRVFPSSSNSTTVYKRISAFNKTFTTSNQVFSVTIPDCLFYPDSGFYSKGVGMVKICYSCIGFTDQGQTLPGGIQYREIIMICRPRSVGISESVVMETHELVNKTTVKQGDTPTVYVVTNPRNVSLEGSNSGTINSGSLTVGTDFALGVDFISQNISVTAYKAILKGTIEAI